MDIDAIRLIGGHPALDFVTSVENRDAADENNYLPSYDALARWAVRAELLAPAEAGRLGRGKAATKVWRDLMRLRGAMHRVFLAVARHEAPPSAALADLNRQIRQAAEHRRLDPQGGEPRGQHSGHLHWGWDAPSSDPRRLQWELALSAAELLTSDRTGRIHKCAHEDCDWLFLDTSRAGSRRWCRMDVCGNITKLRRFRARNRPRLRKSSP